MDPNASSDCLPGRRASVTLQVTDADTAIALGSGDVAVLASPRIVALAEQAAVAALAGVLPPERTSVGAWVELDHREPSAVGQTVTAEAVLLGVHGRRLEFSISVVDGSGTEVAHLRHRRVLVNRARFSAASTDQDRPADAEPLAGAPVATALRAAAAPGETRSSAQPDPAASAAAAERSSR